MRSPDSGGGPSESPFSAIGLTLYFAGAVAFHLRVGDRKGAPPAMVLTMASVALIVLRAATLDSGQPV